MAISIVENSGRVAYGIKGYFVDTEDDVLKLPIFQVPMGSWAYVLDTSNIYLITSEGSWTLRSGNGSSGSDIDEETLQMIYDNAEAIRILNASSSEEGSVAYQIAQIVAGADESYDTLKEVADWISTHGTDAATMNTNINNNTIAINELKTLVGDTSVADQITNALQNDGTDKYALASDLAALSAVFEPVQEMAHTHENKAALDSITQEQIDLWNNNNSTSDNLIEIIQLNNVDLPIVDKTVNIPLATSSNYGVIKADGTTINVVDGVLSVGTISFSNIQMDEDSELIFGGGDASLS